jgi:hypothetical protein
VWFCQDIDGTLGRRCAALQHERVERTGFVQLPQQQVLSDVEDGRLPTARAGALWGVAGDSAGGTKVIRETTP